LHLGVDAGGQRRGPAYLLIGIGAVLVLLTFALAFTIYGEIAGLLGVASIAAGLLVLVRQAQ
jgi:hypothetical protein